MPDNTLQKPLPKAAPSLPRWFVVAKSVIVGLYAGALALCVAGIFVVGLGSMIVYRDFDSYSLAGNPWAPSNFPWYVIWPMRLMSIVAGLVVVAIGFATIDWLLLRASGGQAAATATRKSLAAVITLLLELAVTAWLLHWI